MPLGIILRRAMLQRCPRGSFIFISIVKCVDTERVGILDLYFYSLSVVDSIDSHRHSDEVTTVRDFTGL